MSTTIAHPGRIPSRGPSRKSLVAGLVGLGMAAAVGLGLFMQQSDQSSGGEVQLSSSVSAVDGATEAAQIEEVKGLVRAQSVTIDAWQSRIDFLTDQYAVRNADDLAWQSRIDFLSEQYSARTPLPATSDYLSAGFDYSALTAAESDQSAGVWQSKVDFMTKRHQAEVQKSEELVIPSHFVE